MTIESIAAAVAIMIGVGGALIQIIKVIVQHVTDKESARPPLVGRTL